MTTSALRTLYASLEAGAAGPAKLPVRAATTAALPACTYSASAKTLTGNANGALAAVDGVTMAAGERLLVRSQATGSQNGIYRVTQVGTAGTPFILTRADDFDESQDIESGMLIEVSEGTANADKAFELTTNAPIVLDSTALVFGLQSAGEGLIRAPQVITSGVGQTYTPPTNCTRIMVECLGGGGGGGGSATGAGTSGGGGGGAAGAYARKYYSTAGATFTYTVGVKGTGGAAGNNAGNAGADTTFTDGTTLVTAKGGNGGAGSAGSASILAGLGGAGVIATNGDENGVGENGDGGMTLSATLAVGGKGGGSGRFGTGGQAKITQGGGNAATGRGSGGGGGAMLNNGGTVAGGDGTDGLIVVHEYY